MGREANLEGEKQFLSTVKEWQRFDVTAKSVGDNVTFYETGIGILKGLFGRTGILKQKNLLNQFRPRRFLPQPPCALLIGRNWLMNDSFTGCDKNARE